jgi:hypothetical protein
VGLFAFESQNTGAASSSLLLDLAAWGMPSLVNSPRKNPAFGKIWQPNLNRNATVNVNLLPLPKDRLPEPLTGIVTDNPKGVICWNHRYNPIPEINKEVRSVSVCDSCVYLPTKDQRISNPQSIRVRDHYQNEIACPLLNGSSPFHMV